MIKITVDLSGFDGEWANVEDRAARLGGVLAQEAAIKYERGETNQVPVDRGTLKSFIRSVKKGNTIWIGPTVEYAPYPIYYGPGTGSTKKSTTYLERGVEEGNSDMGESLSARANEFMESGI